MMLAFRTAQRGKKEKFPETGSQLMGKGSERKKLGKIEGVIMMGSIKKSSYHPSILPFQDLVTVCVCSIRQARRHVNSHGRLNHELEKRISVFSK